MDNKLYAIALTHNNAWDEVWIEFYRADDYEHAIEQAANAYGTESIICYAEAPS